MNKELYYKDKDFELLHGDALLLLKKIKHPSGCCSECSALDLTVLPVLWISWQMPVW